MNATGKFGLPKTLPQKEIIRKQASKDNLRRASSPDRKPETKKKATKAAVALPFHSAPFSKLAPNLRCRLARQGHTCAALDNSKTSSIGPVIVGPNVSLTPQALKTLPRASGGRGPSSNYSPATKAILRSPPNGSAERNGHFGKTDKRNLYEEFRHGDPFSSEDRKPVPSRRTRDLGDQAVSSDTSGTEDSDIDSEDYGINKHNSSAKRR